MPPIIVWTGTKHKLVIQSVGLLQVAHTQHTMKEQQVMLAHMQARLASVLFIVTCSV